MPFGEVFIEERNNRWNTPYLFNAKELDKETGLYYYGARYYELRTSVWLSTDPLQEKYPNINTYTFQNPIKYIDLTGMEGDPAEYLKGGKLIDMNNAPASSSVNAKGFYRNSVWFWKQMLAKYPDFFSSYNVDLITDNKSPIVDEQWVKYHKSHGKFMYETLDHHHIDQGRFATGIPKSVHQSFSKLLHPRQGGFFKNMRNKAKVIGGKTMGAFSNLIVVLDFIKIAMNEPSGMNLQFNLKAPLNTAQGYTNPETYFVSGNIFYEITNRNTDNSSLNINWYSGYEKIDGVYRGKGLIKGGIMIKQENGSYQFNEMF